MSKIEEPEQGLRTPRDYVLAALTVFATVAFAVVLVFGLPVAAAWRLSQEGTTALSVVLTALAALWLAILGFGVARDREARGWLVFALVGWLMLPLSALARRVGGRD
jgi:membrane protease YdiL (CAAX protease family)